MRFLSPEDVDRRPAPKVSKVNSHDVKLHYLYARLMILRSIQHPTPVDEKLIKKVQLSLNREITRRLRADQVFSDFIKPTKMRYVKVIPKNFECLRKLMAKYEKKCGGRMQEYELQYVRYFVHECEALPVPSAIDALIHRLEKACFWP